jgi:hypothetical protein
MQLINQHQPVRIELMNVPPMIINVLLFFPLILFASSECPSCLDFHDRDTVVYPSNAPSSTLTWLSVEVPTNKGTSVAFEIMSRPVSQKDFFGYGSESESIDGIDFNTANQFCMMKFNGAVPAHAYAFEHARRGEGFTPPKKIYREMLAPVDYEDGDDIFFIEGDNLEPEDGYTLILFNWKNGSYSAKSMTSSMKKVTFRCSRIKP